MLASHRRAGIWLLGLLALGLLVPKPASAQRKDPFDVEAREYLGTPESEAAVKKGLEFLAARVQPDGHWSSGGLSADAAITGLCTMAFLSAGHQPGRGKYGDMLTKSVDWLAESVQQSGFVNRPGSGSGQPMYGHGFATLAIAELYGMTKRSDLRPKLESAVRLILATQNAEGGWRYQPQVADADISVTAVQLLALRAAHNAGIKVPDEPVKRAVGYIKKCANNKDGGFSYQSGSRGSGPGRTGAALTVLALCNEKDSAEYKGGLQFMHEHPIDKYEWMYREHYMYAMYYCTQAFYQVGGAEWKGWFVPIRQRLISQQQKAGNWQDSPGDEYATAMGVLVLQVPAGLLPIYQK